MPKIRGNGTCAGLTPFRRLFSEQNPGLGLLLAGEHSFPICSTGSKAMKTCEFRGPVKFKLLTTLEELVFLSWTWGIVQQNPTGTKGVLNQVYYCLVQTKSVVKNKSTGSSEV